MTASTDVSVPGREIAPGVFAAGSSLVFTGELSFNDWRRLGEKLIKAAEQAAWIIGDWRAYGDRWDVDGDDDRRDGLAEVDRADRTLRFYTQVARAFPSSGPRGPLSWSHHKAVVSVKDPAERRRLLEEARRQGWSWHELEARVREPRGIGQQQARAALPLRATGAVVARFELLAAARGVEAKELALEILELASLLEDPVAVLKIAAEGAPALLETP